MKSNVFYNSSPYGARVISVLLKRNYPNVPVITTDELQNLMKTSQPRRKLVLLDTREENEFKVSHLSKAVRLNPGETDMSKVIKMIQEKAGPPETDPKTVVFYCAVGYRASIMSQRLLDELKKQQNTSMKPDLDVYNLEGAIFKWGNERKELVDPNGNSTPMVHGVDRVRGTLVFKDIKKLGPSSSRPIRDFSCSILILSTYSHKDFETPTKYTGQLQNASYGIVQSLLHFLPY